jgi:hypothetical protein
MKRLTLILIWMLLWIIAPLALARMLWAIFTNTSRAWEIALSFDDLGNVAANGVLGQSISSRAAHSQTKLWARLLCRVLDGIDPGHCKRALGADDQNLEGKV